MDEPHRKWVSMRLTLDASGKKLTKNIPMSKLSMQREMMSSVVVRARTMTTAALVPRSASQISTKTVATVEDAAIA